MKQIEQNGFAGTEVAEDVREQVGGTPPSVNGQRPFVPEKGKQKSFFKDNGRLLAIGAGIVLALLLLAFNGMPRKPLPSTKTSAANGKQPPQLTNAARMPPSTTPIIDTSHSPEQDTDGSLVHPDQIAHTATKQMKQATPTNLGGIRPFDNTQPWQPSPYQPGAQPATPLAEGSVTTTEGTETRSEHNALDKASLVFVRNNPSSAANPRSQDLSLAMDPQIGLPPGTRLRARLESAVSTAVRTPVVAVIEYNYEQNGEIVIAAGAKAFGHLEAADRSGHLGIRFDSLMMPDGSSVGLEAVATDLQLRPLRGKVEGKNTGKNILVRSFAGVGEIVATLVGRGSLNQPLSEGDLLRERVSNNIGQASDQTVANLAITERVVVSVPAGTEIYVVLEKAAKENVQSARQSPPQTTSQPSSEELRQLIQLQHELNETAVNEPKPE